jgi:hypothetical protein
MFSRITATLAVLCLTLAAALTATGPAVAAPGCQDDRMCLHDTATTGPFFEVEDVDTVRNRCISGITPSTSYITNRTRFRWIVSTSNDCAQNRGVIYPESQGAMGPTWNNRIRGMYRTSSTSLVGEGLPSVVG